MLVLGVLFCTVILLLYYHFTRTFNHWKVRNIAGPEPTILVGNVKDVFFRKEVTSQAMKRFYDAYPKEPFVGIFRMTNPFLMIRDLDLIKNIMIKEFDIFEDRGTLITKDGLGVNLFSADGPTWRVLRHQFTPLFTTGKLKNMLHLIIERGDKFLDYIDNVVLTKPEQEVHVLIQLYTVSTIAACAFGLDIDVTNKDSQFLKTLRNIDNLVFTKKFALELILMYPSFFKKINFSPFARELTNFFKNLVATVVKERNGMPTNRNDFMDLILELKNKGNISGPKKAQESEELSLEITEDIMASQAFVFYAAGYETSATTMTFMLYELARNPHVQEKLHAEIDDVLDKSNGEVTYDTLSQLPYMEKVFDETLRIFPLVDPLQRRAKCDYKIPGTNVTIEKGQIVFVPVMAIHHDETLYPNPEIFDPERFDPKVSAGRHSCAYLPFGVGPRNCIGMRFAKVQSRVCMLKLLSRFRVEQIETKEMTYDTNRVIIGPYKGFQLRFISRNNKKTK